MANVVPFPSEIEKNETVYKSKLFAYNNTLKSSIRIPQKGAYIQMEDIKQLSVYESNELIYAVPKVSPSVIKIFELAVSGLQKNGSAERVSFLSEQSVFFHLQVKNDDPYRYRTLKKFLKEVISTLIFDLSISDEEGEMIVPFEAIKWSKSKGSLEFVFTESIMKYLSELNDGRYTRYALEDISNLSNKYSVFLYKIFIMYFNQYKKYKKEKLRNPYFALEELRDLLNVKENEYTRIDNFTQRVIKDPLKDINQNTTIKVSAEKIKSGRNITGFKFHIEENPKVKKSEILKPKLSKSEREEKRNTAAGKALASDYTQYLIQNYFVGLNELTDVYLMARLYEDLYPLYDQIKEKQGMQKVEQHIKYIHAHLKKPINEISDVVAYLVTCAKSLLKDATFNRQN